RLGPHGLQPPPSQWLYFLLPVTRAWFLAVWVNCVVRFYLTDRWRPLDFPTLPYHLSVKTLYRRPPSHPFLFLSHLPYLSRLANCSFGVLVLMWLCRQDLPPSEKTTHEKKHQMKIGRFSHPSPAAETLNLKRWLSESVPCPRLG